MSLIRFLQEHRNGATDTEIGGLMIEGIPPDKTG